MTGPRTRSGWRHALGLVAVLAAGAAVTTTAGAATPPFASLTSPVVRLGAGASATVPVTLQVGAQPHRVDVVVLLDVSTSMTTRLPEATRQVGDAVRRLVAAGVDVRAGLALAGTSPTPFRGGTAGQENPADSPGHADPAVDPDNPAYRPPVLFRRVLPVGPVASFLAALAAVRAEVLTGNRDTGLVFDRQQAQLLGLDQLTTGRGSPGSPADDFHDAVAPGQVAGWRDDPDVQRYVVSVTDQAFGNPFGTPRTADGEPDVAAVAAALTAQRVRHVGVMAMGFAPGVADLTRLAEATGMRVPSGGLRCGGLTGRALVPSGAPLVCASDAAGLAVEAAVRAARNPVPVTVDGAARDAVFRGLSGTRAVLDGWAAHTLVVTARVACPAAPEPSRHVLPLTATYAGTPVAHGRLTVRCAAAPSVRLRPPPPQPPPAAPPVPAAAVPLAPAPPLPAAAPAAAPAQAPQQAAQAQPGTQVAGQQQEQAQEQVAEQRDDDSVHASRNDRDRHAAGATWLACLVLTAGALVINGAFVGQEAQEPAIDHQHPGSL